MNIAIDIDGTLTRDTEKLKKLMETLVKDENNKVILLTGCINDSPTEAERIAQLAELGIKSDHYTALERCIGTTHEDVAMKKATYCKENNVDLIFEDDDLYIFLINQISPKTSTWLIRRFV
jgi:uncharacterized HAD superfamily protein